MPWKKLAQTSKYFRPVIKTVALGMAILTFVAAGVVVWAFEVRLRNFPVYIYAAPTRIGVGDDITNLEVSDRLSRLGYTRTSSGSVNLGEWRQSDWSMTVNFRRPPITGYRIIQGPVNITLEANRIKDIRLMRSQQQTADILLEPEILTVIPAKGFPAELCRFTPINEIPSLLVDAIVLTEDSNFFSHHGIDWASLMIAIRSNIEAGRYVQGASTITQQLIKMTLLSNEKTIFRKINEIVLSLLADAIYSKNTILEAYLNRVYFGQLGAFPIHGAHEAASELLGKSLGELDASDCALLAAIIRAPNVINPFRHPDRATARRNIVLGLMLKNGKISREIYDEALSKPVTMQRPGAVPVKIPNLIDFLASSEAMSQATSGNTNRFVVTTIDPLLQLRMDAGLRKLPDPSVSAQALVIAPDSGAVLAVYSPLQRSADSFQGSIDLFAPFLLVPAFSTDKKSAPKYALTSQIFLGDSSDESASVLESFRSNRAALTSKMTKYLGVDVVFELLREMGVKVELKSNGELIIGNVDMNKLARTYSILANVGEISEPSLIYRAAHLDKPDVKSGRKQFLNPSAIYLVNHMLKKVQGIGDGDDFTQNLSMIPSRFVSVDSGGVWGIIYNSGGLMVLRLNGMPRDQTKVSALMDQIMEPLLNRNSAPFVPTGILFRKICSDSGLKATSMCPKISHEPFVSGTQPTEWCPMRHEMDTKKPLKNRVR